MGRLVESNYHSTFDGKYQVAFCPQYRRKVLVNGGATRRKELLHAKADEFQTGIIELEVMPDHGHLLIQGDPQFGIQRVVKPLQGYSSHVLRHEFPPLKRRLPSLWTNSYFVATVGAVPRDVVKRYIDDQKGQ